MTAIVELKDATVKVNNGFDTEKTILDHVNLTIREGDFITILGGNGAGKSTLFNVIAGTDLDFNWYRRYETTRRLPIETSVRWIYES